MADTVCIAALCEHLPGKYCVIACSDGRIEQEGVGYSDNVPKSWLLSNEFWAMISGPFPKAKELCDRYSLHLSRTQVTPDNVFEELRKPFAAQNRADVLEYVSSTFGLNPEHFDALSQTDRAAAVAGFPKRNTDLILIWLCARMPRLFIVNGFDVQEHGPFAAIGCGWQAAQAALFARDFGPEKDLAHCMYAVYDAKRTSESVPGVGKTTHLMVLEYDDEAKRAIYHPFGPFSLDVLAKQYQVFGPKPFRAAACSETLDLKSVLRLKAS